MKICRKCSTEKENIDFPPQRRTCKTCRSAAHKLWHVKNRQHKREKDRQYRKANSKRKNETIKKWLARPGEKQLKYRLGKCLRNQLNRVLRKILKAGKALELLGCSVDFFREHLEKQFQPGMTWVNHTSRGWHIDHKRPCASFDLTKPAQQKECFHYSNLQPLWAIDNLIKGDRI